jgi:hypothetical protein
MQERTSPLINNDYTNTELGKRGKHRWSGRSFIKWLEDSNLKYKRLSVWNKNICFKNQNLFVLV